MSTPRAAKAVHTCVVVYKIKGAYVMTHEDLSHAPQRIVLLVAIVDSCSCNAKIQNLSHRPTMMEVTPNLKHVIASSRRA